MMAGLSGMVGSDMSKNEEMPTVVAENFMTVAPDLTIKVVVLSNGQRVIPEEDMKRACEWLGVDLSSLESEEIFGGLTTTQTNGDDL